MGQRFRECVLRGFRLWSVISPHPALLFRTALTCTSTPAAIWMVTFDTYLQKPPGSRSRPSRTCRPSSGGPPTRSAFTTSRSSNYERSGHTLCLSFPFSGTHRITAGDGAGPGWCGSSTTTTTVISSTSSTTIQRSLFPSVRYTRHSAKQPTGGPTANTKPGNGAGRRETGGRG